jgi:DNA-binding protein WhiA
LLFDGAKNTQKHKSTLKMFLFLAKMRYHILMQKEESKMSFSKQVKEELLQIGMDDDDMALAFLCGVVRSVGNIQVQDGQFSIIVVTDVVQLYEYCNKIFKQLYGDYAELEIVEKSIINKTTYYSIKFPTQSARQILQDIGLWNPTDPQNQLQNQVDQHILKNQDCIIAFIRAVFLTCFTSSIKLSEVASQKSNTGYHLEFTSHNKGFLDEFSQILASQGIFARTVQRKNLHVLYLKDAGSISDLLALVGANQAVLDLQNEMIARQLRSTVNRQINCLSANLDKTVGANAKQLEAIEIINSTIGLEALSEELQEVALLRLANTEESLQELVKLSGLTLTKSGINHRMRKIIKIAQELKE